MNIRKTFVLLSVVLNAVAIFILVDFLTSTSDVTSVFEDSLPSPTGVSDEGEVIGEYTVEDENVFKVAKVIDGDTVSLSTGDVVRYIGIDTPENPGDANEECYAKRSEEKNKKLVEGKLVYLEKDVSEVDRYGRLLRYVWTVDDRGEKETFVNKEMVILGFASAATYPPDIKYQDTFRLAEIEAKERNLGLWGNCFLGPQENSSDSSAWKEWDCSSNLYDCSDFTRQSEAQSVLEACGVSLDIHKLDRDSDSVACESLP